jgi:hypothetical protein
MGGFMSKLTTPAVRIFAVACLVVLSVVSVVQTAPKKNSEIVFPLSLNIIAADDALVASGGWPLTIQIAVPNATAMYTDHGFLPAAPLPIAEIRPGDNYSTGTIFLTNPDLSDPKYLFFAIGSDIVQNISWNGGFVDPPFNNPAQEPIPSGGKSSRIPGLVILSDSGIGNYYEASKTIPNSYVLTSPRQARNLAAFINSVGYVLRDGQNTTITASWIAPANIISPYVERDSNVHSGSPSPTNTHETKLRINGGAIQDATLFNYSGPLDSILRDEDVLTINLRVFVVNGNAPNSLYDWNGDNIVDSKDAALTPGITLLSEEKRIRLRIAMQHYFGILVDLDQNGSAGIVVSPPTPAGLTVIPD